MQHNEPNKNMILTQGKFYQFSTKDKEIKNFTNSKREKYMES